MHPLLPGARLRARVFRYAVAAVAIAAAVASAPARADDGGMMDFILHASRGGPARAHAIAPRYDVSPAYIASQPAARPKSKSRHFAGRGRKIVRRHIARLRPVLPPPPAAPEIAAAAKSPPREVKITAADAYLADRTLRRGDIIATVHGLRVFKGAAHFPYVDTDFAALAKGPRVQNVAMLQAIDRMIRRDHRAENARTAVASAASARPPRATRAAHVARAATGRRATLAYAPASRTMDAPAVRAIAKVSRPARRGGYASSRIHSRWRHRPLVREARMRTARPHYFYGPAPDIGYSPGFWRVVLNR